MPGAGAAGGLSTAWRSVMTLPLRIPIVGETERFGCLCSHKLSGLGNQGFSCFLRF